MTLLVLRRYTQVYGEAGVKNNERREEGRVVRYTTRRLYGL